MAFLTARTGVATLGSTGTQNLTISGFGTPIAISFYVTQGATLGTSATHYLAAIGFGADDNTGAGYCCAAENGTSATDTMRWHDVAAPVMDIADHNGTLKGSFEFLSNGANSGPITDGWQINISNDTSLAGLQIV